MTVAEIITAARQYTQISNSEWFNSDDEYRSINRAYRDLYEKILDANDEYFIKELTVPVGTLTQVRPHMYEYQLPSDWYRLRRLVGLNGESVENLIDRLDPLNISMPDGYRYFNNKLRIRFYSDYTDFRIEYYPAPAQYSDSSDIIQYPPQLEPLIIAYQMAMDIAKQQNADPTKHAEEYLRLWNRFESATMKRDNSRYPKIANMYRTTYPGW